MRSLEERQLQLRADVRAVMGTPAGRRFMHHVLEGLCGTFRETYTGEPMSSVYAQGKRGAGLEIQKLLQDFAPAEFVLLLGEELGARENNPRP